MSKLLRSFVVLGLAAIGVFATMPSALAATDGGYDVSYPQCGTALPTGQAFGIVGVNGGLATTANSCLSTQLGWAWQSVGGTLQPKAQAYLNTANPGQIRHQVTTWPSSGTSPYGNCNGANNQACSWVYGYQRAQKSVQTFFEQAATAAGVSTNPGDYVWWLDVETANTWETGGSAALANNRAALEGWTYYLQTVAKANVGLYSTASQWRQIAGTVPATSSLYTLNSWLPGASTAAGATTNCNASPLVAGGKVTLAQYVSGGFDHDVSCV